MIQVKIKEEDILPLEQGRYNQLHPRVMQKYNALWLKYQGLSNQQICKVEKICNNTLLSFFKQYNAGGLQSLQTLNFHCPKSKMAEFSGRIEQYFEKNPPSSIGEAVEKIEELTGIRRGKTQVRKFLKERGFRFRRVGTVPAKAQTEEKKTNRENFWSKN